MRRTNALLALLAVCLAGALTAVPALALSPVIKNCEAHSGDSLSGHFTISQLQQALNSMPSDAQQYTVCAQVIQHALQVREGKTKLKLNGGSGGGSGFPVLLVVVIVAVVLAAGGYGLYAYRRR